MSESKDGFDWTSLPPIDGMDGKLSFVAGIAREVQTKLDTNPDISPENIGQLVNYLDKQWPYMKEKIRLSGIAYFVEGVNEDGRPIVSKKVIQDHEMVSGGFMLLPKSYLHEEDISSNQLAVVHVLVCSQTGKEFLAGIEEVSGDFPFEPTELEKIETMYYYPELTNEIDEIFIEGDEDEVKILRGLGGLSVDFRLNNDDQDSFGAIEKYVNEDLYFDLEVPYLLRTDLYGLLDNQQDMDLENIEFTETFMGFPVGVNLRKDPYSGETETYRFWLVFSVLVQDKLSDGSYNILVPLSEDLDMSPLRPALFDKINNINN